MGQGREGKQLRVVHITMPNSVSLQINRWTEAYEGDYINVKITMPAQPNQDGHCGNFNGDPEDDKRLAIRARVGTNGVDPSVLLFNTKTPVVQANRPDINNCPEDRADQAKSACQTKGAQELAACMVDVLWWPRFRRGRCCHVKWHLAGRSVLLMVCCGSRIMLQDLS